MYNISSNVINVGFVFLCISCLLLHIMLVNVNVDVSGYNRTTIQGCRFHWFC